MIETVLFDTNALLRLFKGTSETVKKMLMRAQRVVIPLAVYGEFSAGLDLAAASRKCERDLFHEFLTMPNVEVHRPTEATARFYAKIFRELKKAGRPIPTNDIWIAAEAMEIGGHLCSCDRHFDKIPMLDWTYCE